MRLPVLGRHPSVRSERKVIVTDCILTGVHKNFVTFLFPFLRAQNRLIIQISCHNRVTALTSGFARLMGIVALIAIFLVPTFAFLWFG